VEEEACEKIEKKEKKDERKIQVKQQLTKLMKITDGIFMQGLDVEWWIQKF